MSKKAAVLAAAILLLTSGVQQAKQKSTQSDWVVFSPKDSGFSVTLPGKPTERPFPQSTGKAWVPAHKAINNDQAD